MKILEGLTSQLYQSGASANATQCGVVADVGGFNLRQHGCLSCNFLEKKHSVFLLLLEIFEKL
jgi:hypothetical protein